MVIYRLMKSHLSRSGAVVTGLIGFVAIILGWVGISGVTLPAEQLPYLVSGGILGIFFLGVAATLWLSADLHDQWRKLDEIHRSITEQAAVPIPAEPPAQPPAQPPASESNGHAPTTAGVTGRSP